MGLRPLTSLAQLLRTLLNTEKSISGGKTRAFNTACHTRESYQTERHPEKGQSRRRRYREREREKERERERGRALHHRASSCRHVCLYFYSSLWHCPSLGAPVESAIGSIPREAALTLLKPHELERCTSTTPRCVWASCRLLP